MSDSKIEIGTSKYTFSSLLIKMKLPGLAKSITSLCGASNLINNTSSGYNIFSHTLQV